MDYEAIPGWLQPLVHDNTSGSIAIANQLGAAIALQYPGTLKEAAPFLQLAAPVILDHLGTFAAVWHLMNELMHATEKQPNIQVSEWMDAYQGRWRWAEDRMAAHFVEFCGTVEGPWLTHSHSGNVMRCLTSAAIANRVQGVYQTVSHPMREGITQARLLADEGVPVTVVEEGAISTLPSGIRGVLLGADAVLPNNWINKTGSHLLSLFARDRNIPVVVVADTRKWVPLPRHWLKLVQAQHPPDEICPQPTPFQIHNVYFEDLPIGAADWLISEMGPIKPAFVFNAFREVRWANGLLQTPQLQAL